MKDCTTIKSKVAPQSMHHSSIKSKIAPQSNHRLHHKQIKDCTSIKSILHCNSIKSKFALQFNEIKDITIFTTKIAPQWKFRLHHSMCSKEAKWNIVQCAQILDKYMLSELPQLSLSQTSFMAFINRGWGCGCWG